MTCGTRREPEGIYHTGEDLNIRRQSSGTGTTASREWLQTNFDDGSTSDDDDIAPSSLMRALSLDGAGEVAGANPPLPQDWSCGRDVPVCLHPQQEGSPPGVSPVLITLPLENSNNLQAFVPCTVCHLPNLTTPGPGASDTVAFCVSEINIRTSQLVLVPCYTCWRSRPVTGMPEQIKVPLLHSILNGNAGENRSEDSLRFVPCSVCLSAEHTLQLVRPLPPVFLESRSQQTHSQGTETNHQEETGEGVFNVLEPSFDKSAVAWFVPFSERLPEDGSLQLAFLLHCGQVVKKVRQRQKELPEKAFGRQQYTKPKPKPPPVKNLFTTGVPLLTGYRHLSHSQMRQQTERIYKALPEVREQQIQQLREQMRNSHRITAYVFQKKLQRATLRGKVSWRISESCI